MDINEDSATQVQEDDNARRDTNAEIKDNNEETDVSEGVTKVNENKEKDAESVSTASKSDKTGDNVDKSENTDDIWRVVQEESVKVAQEEEKKIAEEEQKRQEKERKKLEEEEKRIEKAKQKEEAMEKQKAEKDRKKLEKEDKRKQEEERRAEEKVKRKEDEKQKQEAKEQQRIEKEREKEEKEKEKEERKREADEKRKEEAKQIQEAKEKDKAEKERMKMEKQKEKEEKGNEGVKQQEETDEEKKKKQKPNSCFSCAFCTTEEVDEDKDANLERKSSVHTIQHPMIVAKPHYGTAKQVLRFYTTIQSLETAAVGLYVYLLWNDSPSNHSQLHNYTWLYFLLTGLTMMVANIVVCVTLTRGSSYDKNNGCCYCTNPQRAELIHDTTGAIVFGYGIVQVHTICVRIVHRILRGQTTTQNPGVEELVIALYIVVALQTILHIVAVFINLWSPKYQDFRHVHIAKEQV